jgi:hypothetical protein
MKYRFKKQYSDAQIVIPHLRLTITKDNLTDELAEMILTKFEHLAHNIEPINDSKAIIDEEVKYEVKKKK